MDRSDASSAHQPRERVVTLPNLLTLSRIPMAVAVWFAGRRAEILIPLMVAAAVTDLLDGRFARAIRKRREARGEDPGGLAGPRSVGAWLDPLCDKTFVVSLLGAIWWMYEPGFEIVLMIAAREVFLVPLALGYRFIPALRKKMRFDIRAGMVGKLATVCQFAAVAAILVAPAQVRLLAIASAVTGLFAVVHYVSRAMASLR